MFNGSDYNPALDDARLTTQMGKVYSFMSDSQWHTLQEIAKAIDEPEASISAQLRHLRKPRFGNYIVSKQRRGDQHSGLFEYRLLKRPAQPDLFQMSGVEIGTV